MKQIADRMSKAATKQATSVQPFAGGILNKYKTGTSRHKFERAAMSHLLKNEPNITEQILHIQVVAPKITVPNTNNKQKVLSSPERKVERIIKQERVTVERETIIFRDVTHVIKELRTIREIAVTQPVGSQDANIGVSQKPFLSKQVLEVTEINRETKIAKKEISTRTIPQASLLPNRTWKAEKHADYYKWLQTKLQPGIHIQSLRRIEDLKNRLLKDRLLKDRIPLKSITGKDTAHKHSPLLLTNVRRVFIDPKQHSGTAEAVSKKIDKTITRTSLANEQREAEKKAEAVKRDQQKVKKDAEVAGKEQREAEKKAEAVKQEQQKAKRDAEVAGKEQSEAEKKAEAVKRDQQKAKRDAEVAGKEQSEAEKKAEAVKREQQKVERDAEVASKEQRKAEKQAEAVKQEQQKAKRNAAVLGKEQQVADRGTEVLGKEQLVVTLRKFRAQANKNDLSHAKDAKEKSRKPLEYLARVKHTDAQLQTDLIMTEQAPSQPYNETQIQMNDSANKAIARSASDVLQSDSASGQINIKFPTGVLTSFNQARLQQLIMQRRLPFLALLNEPSNSPAIVAKYLIHRTERSQAKQALPNEIQSNTNQNNKSAAQSVVRSNKNETNTSPNEFLIASSNGKTAELAPSIRMLAKEIALKSTFGAEGTSRRTLILKPMQMVLRRFHRGQHTQSVETVADKAKVKKVADQKDHASDVNSQMKVDKQWNSAAKDRHSLHPNQYPSRKAMIHRLSSAVSKQQGDFQTTNENQNDASSKRQMDSAASAVKFSDRDEIQKNDAAATLIDDAKVIVRGQMVARDIQSKKLLLQNGLELSFKRGVPRTNSDATQGKINQHMLQGNREIASTSRIISHVDISAEAQSNKAHTSKAVKRFAAEILTVVKASQSNQAQIANKILENKNDRSAHKQVLQQVTGQLLSGPILVQRVARKQTSPTTESANDVSGTNSSKTSSTVTSASMRAYPTLGSENKVRSDSPQHRTTAAIVKKATGFNALTTVVQGGLEQNATSPVQASNSANEKLRLSYAATGSNRNGTATVSSSAEAMSSPTFAERGAMPTLSHHKPRQTLAQEPPRQVKIDAPRELDPVKLQKMIMKMPQLRPEAIADQVYKALERKMKLEQRRRGL